MSRAASNVFLTVHGVGGEQHAGEAEVADHLLGGRNFVGFVVDLGMGEHDSGVGGEGGQGLSRLAVVDVVETAAQNLAVERDRRSFARRRLWQQALGVEAQNFFEMCSIKRVQHMAQRVQGRRPLQTDAEMPVEVITPLIENPDPSNVGPEDLHTSMPRDTPFIYGEFKSRAVANTTPGKIAVA